MEQQKKMSNDAITLEQFIAAEHKRVDAFEAHYLTEHVKDSTNWPLKAAPGFWDEQLLMYEKS